MTTTVVPNLVLLNSCESNTGWTTDGPSISTYTGWQREGTNCLGHQNSQTTIHSYVTVASVNLTGQRFYAWILTWGNPDTTANGGLRLILGDGTNRRAYYVGGNDTIGFVVAGGWRCLAMEANNPSPFFQQLAGTGAPDMTAITQVGIGSKFLNKATGNTPNLFWDVLRYGRGLTIHGGTSASPGIFREIAEDDASTDAGKAYGIIRKLVGNSFGVQGDLIWGDSTGSSAFYFKDTDAILLWENIKYATGSASTPYRVKFNGNSSAATQSFILGTSVGSGDAESGVAGAQFINSNATQSMLWNMTNNNIQTYECYGTIWRNIKSGSATPDILFSSGSSGSYHKLRGCSFSNCGVVYPGSITIRNTTFQGYTGTDAALLWTSGSTDVKNSIFLGNTSVTNDPAGIEIDSASYVTFDGIEFASNDYDVYNSSNSPVTMSIVGGGSSPSVRNGGSGTSQVLNNINVTLTGLQIGTEVRIYDSTTQVEVGGIEDTVDTTFSFSYGAGEFVDIVIHKTNYEYIRTNNYEIPSTDTSLPIEQRFDRNYSDP